MSFISVPSFSVIRAKSRIYIYIYIHTYGYDPKSRWDYDNRDVTGIVKIVISENPKVRYVKRKRTMRTGILQSQTPVKTVKNWQYTDTERQKTNRKFNKTIYSGIYMK